MRMPWSSADPRRRAEAMPSSRARTYSTARAARPRIAVAGRASPSTVETGRCWESEVPQSHRATEEIQCRYCTGRGRSRP